MKKETSKDRILKRYLSKAHEMFPELVSQGYYTESVLDNDMLHIAISEEIDSVIERINAISEKVDLIAKALQIDEEGYDKKFGIKKIKKFVEQCLK